MDAEDLERHIGDLVKQVGDMMCWHLGAPPFGDAIREATRPLVRDMARAFAAQSGAWSLESLNAIKVGVITEDDIRDHPPLEPYRKRPAGGSGQAKAYPPPPPRPAPGQGAR